MCVYVRVRNTCAAFECVCVHNMCIANVSVRAHTKWPWQCVDICVYICMYIASNIGKFSVKIRWLLISTIANKVAKLNFRLLCDTIIKISLWRQYYVTDCLLKQQSFPPYYVLLSYTYTVRWNKYLDCRKNAIISFIETIIMCKALSISAESL